ncbi:MAG: cobalamin-dependent protein [Thermoleophilia bacterium]|nr:cobalamin-dependent protein [Thermoleophilia bacterium]
MLELTAALTELDEGRLGRSLQESLGAGDDPQEILQACNTAMAEIGRRFSLEEYFLSELMFSAELFKGVMRELEPLLGSETAASGRGSVVIGTVQGDIHDIGKNIVATLLKTVGFTVVDLGVDVPAASFVAAVRETGTKVLGLSALLNSTYPEMKNVVDALAAARLRQNVTVVIGGAPCSEEVRVFAGADYYAPDAGVGVDLCAKIIGSAG